MITGKHAMINSVIKMDFSNRKRIRLKTYDYSQEGAYFVTICTQDRTPILSEIVGDGFPVPKFPGMIAEEMLLQIPQQYPTVRIEKYVIMPDHIHVLLQIIGTGDPSPTIDFHLQILEFFEQKIAQNTELHVKP